MEREIDEEMQKCIDDTQKALDVIMYRIGERPPNYPVPAPIYLRTFIGEFCIHCAMEFFQSWRTLHTVSVDRPSTQ